MLGSYLVTEMMMFSNLLQDSQSLQSTSKLCQAYQLYNQLAYCCVEVSTPTHSLISEHQVKIAVFTSVVS